MWIWGNIQSLRAESYRCGHCGDHVASDRGWDATTKKAGGRTSTDGRIRICPSCWLPTTFYTDRQVPGARIGAEIRHLPTDTNQLYEEARASHAVAAYTASVLTARKILMHVAVEKGAQEGLRFAEYVHYLDRERYLGRDGKGWVDLIRSRSNEANHQITLMTREDSEHMLSLLEMLLRLVYELPGNLPKSPDPVPTPDS